MPFTEISFGCVACDVTGPATAGGWQLIFSGAISGVVLAKMAAQDLIGLFLHRAGDGGDQDENQGVPHSPGSKTDNQDSSGESPTGQKFKTKLGESFRMVLATFGAVQLASGEFIRNAAPSLDITVVPSAVAIKVIVAIQLLPFLALLVLDRFVAARYSQKALRRYRSTLFAVVLVLVLRQVELYFGPAKSLVANLEAFSPLVLAIVSYSILTGAIVLAAKALKGVMSFFAYFSPAALVLMLAMTSSQPSHNAYYANYDFSEAGSPVASQSPVFVVVFDEFSYEALLNFSGEIDESMFPNFARLGRESLHFTNASSNYFRTWLQVPALIDALLPLTDSYELRIYEQTHRIEAHYADGCGSQYTCRGLRYVTNMSDTAMASYIAMRSTYHAVPDWVENAARLPLGLLARYVGSPPPPSDPIGVHEISSALIDLYLEDISRGETGGRIFLLHTLVPHDPYVFDKSGKFEVSELRALRHDPQEPLTDKQFEELWEHYREQIRYADNFLGEMIAALEAADLYDNAVIIVTADHGARPLNPVSEEAIPIDSLSTHVPLFIRSPRVIPTMTPTDYQHIDFGPTLYDLLGLEYAYGHDAHTGEPIVTALTTSRPQRQRVFYVDVPGRYWRYEYRDESNTWDVVAEVNEPIWDQTTAIYGAQPSDDLRDYAGR